MLPWSPDTILIAALVVFVAIITIFVFHILLGVQRLIRLGEVRREYGREEQAYLTSLYGERWGLRTGGEGDGLVQQPHEEFKEPKSQPVARPLQDQGQNLETQHRADELEEEILRLKQDYKKLEEDLEQVREHQRGRPGEGEDDGGFAKHPAALEWKTFFEAHLGRVLQNPQAPLVAELSGRAMKPSPRWAARSRLGRGPRWYGEAPAV